MCSEDFNPRMLKSENCVIFHVDNNLLSGGYLQTGLRSLGHPRDQAKSPMAEASDVIPLTDARL
jgi:hypothetical protein